MILENTAIFFRRAASGLWWLISLPLQFANFFSSPKHQYPEGEEGMLMRRSMEHQSLIDNVSHWWFTRSVFGKTLYFLGATLTSAWLGLLIGSATLFVLTTGVVFALTHTLLTSHEENRRTGAELAAKENISLAKQLNDSKQLLDRATALSNEEAANLHQQAEAVVIQIEDIDTQTKIIDQRNKELAEIILAVDHETTALCDQERRATKCLKDMSDELGHCNDVIRQSTVKIGAVEDALTKVSTFADTALKNQEKLSEAIDRFSLFAQTPGKLKSSCGGTGYEEYIRQTKAENDADDLLIESYRKMLQI